MRGRRFVVASVSSMVWPAVTVLIPMGITFAAMTVYADVGPAPVACDAGTVIACADGGEAGSPCAECGSATCACRASQCGDPAAATQTLVCTSIPACASAPTVCAGKNSGDTCTTSANAPGACAATKARCLPDAGNVQEITILDCAPIESTSSGGTSSSSGASGNTGDFEPGPTKVPGSSSSGGDDSGCTTTPGSVPTTALFGVPVAIGLLFALRKRQPRKAPSARKRS